MHDDPTSGPSRSWPRGGVLSALLLVLMLGLSLSGDFRDTARDRIEVASERALTSFAVARGLNGIISVLQEMEIGFSFGVSGSMEPGQILDPLNDLIERFSLAALTAATVLWTLRLLGEWMIAPWLVGGLLAGLAAGAMLWRLNRWGSAEVGLLAIRLVRALMLVWAFAALTPFAIHWVHHSDAVQGRYETAQQHLTQARDLLVADGDLSRDAVLERLEQARTFADRLSRDAITVLSVFVFEVLLLPMLVFWLGSRLLAAPMRGG